VFGALGVVPQVSSALQIAVKHSLVVEHCPLLQHCLQVPSVQRWNPASQVHCPPTHVEFAGQTFPQAPQLFRSFVLQTPAQQIWPTPLQPKPGPPLIWV
jgi:hypothetical protein